MEEDWISTADAAALSGYNIIHLRRLIRSKKILARKFGPLWQVSRMGLQEYLNAAAASEDDRRGPKAPEGGRHE